ncbi:hypothetical protein [Vulcanisaeta souniana]|uniref:Uncharacterized protein n=1 Tax=Vulcanisaeta souniana JCM 11219 TaxID=1293586 RepID=A0A830EC76_9CREN|nr:hypothetical protein [Vulcanisaeta souniana]BDR92074.1 hypothetical protein Vsou_11670 [Vulcanisaeta souniana JCM 11219]GGI68084.1 hypothetical protein GCM10007112_01400 [Vulcanisaeta souniana JCM 11219]
MFGRKKKVDLEELLQELTDDGDSNGKGRIKRRVGDVEDYEQSSGVRFKVEFEGTDELIKEIKSLRESINELIELLREKGDSATTKR